MKALLINAPQFIRVLVTVALLSSQLGLSAERDAPFTFNSRLTAPGSRELQVWLTPRVDRSAFQTRVTPRFGIDFGVLRSLSVFVGSEATIESLPNEANAFDGNAFAQLQFSPLRVERGFGVSAIVRAAAGLTSVDVEARLGVDAQVGALWFGLNSSVEQRLWYRFTPGIATRLEQSAALRYAFPNDFSMGFEGFFRSAFARGPYQGSGLYLGPQFTFKRRSWWLAAGLYAQVYSVKARADRGNGERLEFRDNERFVLRLTLGITP